MAARRRPAPRPRVPRYVLGIAVLLSLLTATACTRNEIISFGMLEPITEQGRRILNLWVGAAWAAIAVGAVVWGLTIWACLFHRKRSEELPPQVRYNLPIEVLYTVVPFIIIAVLFYFTVRDQNFVGRLSANPDVRVNVTAFQWSWRFDYPDHQLTVVGRPGQDPQLVIPAGRSVRFHMETEDVIHSFWVPNFLFKRDVIPGYPNDFEVKVDETAAGDVYAGRCAEFCGAYHSRMLFSVRVVTPAEFAQYVAGQQVKAGSAQ